MAQRMYVRMVFNGFLRKWSVDTFSKRNIPLNPGKCNQKTENFCYYFKASGQTREKTA
jgi:hypothetical protein